VLRLLTLVEGEYPSYGPHLDGSSTIPSDQSLRAEGTLSWSNAVANDATPPERSSGGERSGIGSGAGSRSATSAIDRARRTGPSGGGGRSWPAAIRCLLISDMCDFASQPSGQLAEMLPDAWFASHPWARRKKAS
jgi:hypothetical protein